uniref:Galectin n=1 Tax=Ditylenchus dipsaci TaxID=166011 RepID=A0A915D4R8_9BILA
MLDAKQEFTAMLKKNDSFSYSNVQGSCTTPPGYLYTIQNTMNSTAVPQEQTSNVVHNNPQLPYASAIPGGVFPGRAIVIKGMVQSKSTTKDSRFAIDLCCGQLVEGNHRDNKALHLNPRFNYGGSWFSKSDNDIVVNSLVNNSWGAEQRCPNVLAMSKPFSIRILVLRDYFKIAVNGKQLCDYIHRLPLEDITFIYINGCCIHLDLVEFQGTEPPTSSTPSGSLSDDKMESFDICKPKTPFIFKLPRVDSFLCGRHTVSNFYCNERSGLHVVSF